MLFIGFEYKSLTECAVELRQSGKGGAITIGHIDVPIETVRMAQESIDSFLRLLDAGVLVGPDSPR